MSTIGSILTRTTTLMASDQLNRALRATHNELLDIQRQIMTGKQINRPSDQPSKVSAVMFLREAMTAREQYDRNLQHALGMLNTVDQALGDANNIILEARQIALSQIAVGSDATTRKLEADVVDAQLTALIDIANRQYNKLSLFGGTQGATPDGNVFQQFLGGVRYLGSSENLAADVGGVRTQPFTSNGMDAFGALSSRIRSLIDLNPQPAANTLVSDVNGAQSLGVRPGTIRVVVNGSQVNLDLHGINTLGDVATRVNDAIETLEPGAGSLAISGDGYELTANAGHSITISDIGTGQTAADLGINLSAASGSVSGPDIQTRLTEMTRLADFGQSVDWSSGLLIKQGDIARVADFSNAQNVQDLQNVIKGLDLGLRLEINAQGNGLDLISEVSGITLTVGENGGTTAADLGLRTFDLTTQLGDFNKGNGVQMVEGDDIEISLHDGTTFTVNLSGATTVGDVVQAIEAAAGAAGAVQFSVGMAANGNGFTFTDNTAGGEAFAIRNVGTSLAATHLGIRFNVEADSSFTSDDLSGVRVDSVFTHLMELRNALLADDSSGIAFAGSRLEKDLDKLTQARALVGVNARRVEDAQKRSEDMAITEKTMLSDLEDADLTEAITRFTQLTQQLQASMASGAQSLQLSFLDFLR